MIYPPTKNNEFMVSKRQEVKMFSLFLFGIKTIFVWLRDDLFLNKRLYIMPRIKLDKICEMYKMSPSL